MRTPRRRYPLAPLLDRMGLDSRKAAARHLRISGSTEQDYRHRGVTERVADRLAVKAGLNPFEVWPEMADHAIEDHREAERERRRRAYATNPKVAARKKASAAGYYAENRDYVLARERRRYAADPQRQRDRAAAWYAANRDEHNRRRRERYARRQARGAAA